MPVQTRSHRTPPTPKRGLDDPVPAATPRWRNAKRQKVMMLYDNGSIAFPVTFTIGRVLNK